MLIVLMVFSISMPAIVVADESTMPANSSAQPATPSAYKGQPSPPSDAPEEVVPEVEDEVEPTDDSNETAPPPLAPNDPGNDIPEVEDEVDPTEGSVETAPPSAAPDAPGGQNLDGVDDPDSTNDTVERAPPIDGVDTPDETDLVIEETTEPTEEPTPAETPASPSTPEPTETPIPSPTPSPTPEPAVPFKPTMTCVNSPDSQAPVAGDTAWAYVDCTASWETKDVSGVSLLPVNAPVGWAIVPLNDRTIQNPDTMILNPKPLDLIDAHSASDEFVSSKFHLAMRVSCVDPTSVTVPLQFHAKSGADAVQETATVKHPLNATAATLPEVTLTSAVFEDVNPPEGTDVSTGAITMEYSNASEHCGWKITTNIEDFVAEDDVLSASDLSLVDVIGPDGLTSSIENGEITLFAAPGIPMPASGTITVTVSIPVPETVGSGVYSTTITADAGAP